MPIEKVEEAIIAYSDWPTEISIIGGEPLLHPQLKEINALLRKYLPQEKLNLFTAGLPNMNLETSNIPCDPNSCYEWRPEFPWTRWPENNSDLTRTYRTIRFNPHSREQMSTCSHHPLTVAVSEAVPNEALMWKLINNCWLQRCWSPTVNIHGAYFCEVGAAIDMILFDGANAWGVVKHWWKRRPEEFQEQVSKICVHCGMCLPQERQQIGDSSEIFSPLLLDKFKELGMQRLDNVAIVKKTYNIEDIEHNAKSWYPGNYREDIVDDEEIPEFFKGLSIPLRLDIGDERVFPVDTQKDYSASLERAAQLPISEGPYHALKRRYFLYKNIHFDALYDQYPFVLQEHKNIRKLYYRGLMLYLKALTDNEHFSSLPREDCCDDDLFSLPNLIMKIYAQHTEMQVKKIAQLLNGKHVYFWGCGAAWERYQHIFSNVIPLCFLVGANYKKYTSKNLPIYHPEEVPQKLKLEKNSALVVFARRQHISNIEKNIAKIEWLRDKNIFWAPMDD
jgi:hypothetical protein